MTEQLEAQNVHDDEFERRGRAVSRREPLAHNEEKRGRSKSKHLEVISQGGDEDGMELSKGVHMFEFAFIVPADSPPYDRSPFGKVRYMVKVTALGAGRARRTWKNGATFFLWSTPVSYTHLTLPTILLV